MPFRSVDAELVQLGGRSTNSGITVNSPIPFEIARYSTCRVLITWAASNMAGVGFSLWCAATSLTNANSAVLVHSIAQVAVDSFWVVLQTSPVPNPYAIGYLKATNPNSSYAGTWSAQALGKSYSV